MKNSARMLLDAELSAHTKLSSAGIELRVIEDGMADALTSNDEKALGIYTDRRAELDAKIRAIEGSINSLRESRVAAIEAENRQVAASLRTKAAGLRDESNRVTAACKKHLAELGKLQECEFDSSILMGQRLHAGWYQNPVANIFPLPDLLRSSAEMAPNSPTGGAYAVPLSRRLAVEAFILDDKAAAMERAEVRKSGRAEGADASELFNNLTRDPATIQPRLDEIDLYMEACDQVLEHMFPGGVECTRRYNVSWLDGVLDWSASTLEVQSHRGPLTIEPRDPREQADRRRRAA